MLYDMTGQMATRLRTLLRCFWRRIIARSRDMRLMADVSSSVGEDVMLWSGCTKHRAPHCKVFKNRQLLSHLGLDPLRVLSRPHFVRISEFPIFLEKIHITMVVTAATELLNEYDSYKHKVI